MVTALDTPAPAGAAIGVAAALVLLGAALRTGVTAPIPLAVLLLGALYAAPAGDRTIPVPVYAALLLLTAELAYWSIDERVPERAERGLAARRLGAVLALAGVATVAATVVVAAAGAAPDRSPVLTAAGAAAVVAVAAVLVRLAAGRTR